MGAGNILFYGDNLDVLRGRDPKGHPYVPDESVDLVYLDPPFNSQQDYNVLFAEHRGTRSAAQFKAFEDTWSWDEGAASAYQEVVDMGGRVSDAMRAFWTLLGASDMMAYLSMMAPRLIELRRALKSTGSIYLHCDPTASAHLRLLMDAIFGPQQFRNEIIWRRTAAHSDAKRWARVHDTILFYTKSKAFAWNPEHAPHSEEYVADKYRFTEPDGRRYMLDNMTSPHPRPNMMYEWKGHACPPFGWRYSRDTMARLDSEGRVWYPDSKNKRPRLKRYLDEMPGTLVGTVWTDIAPINSRAQERLGYPTQKPKALLERIILASSEKGDLVLDPFCGCGTTIEAAEALERRWVGIDITHLAVGLMKARLSDAFGGRARFDVVGEPTDLAGAEQLALEDKFQFECWALGLVGARHTEHKKGADRGIDGRLFFRDEGELGVATKQVIISVKGGGTGAAHVRDLVGVLETEQAQIGVLISLQEPTSAMRSAAASVGFFHSNYTQRHHPRVQLLTVKELLEGKGIDYPGRASNVTLKRAPEVTTRGVENLSLFEDGGKTRPAKKRKR